jgi:hypothetical protein
VITVGAAKAGAGDDAKLAVIAIPTISLCIIMFVWPSVGTHGDRD